MQANGYRNQNNAMPELGSSLVDNNQNKAEEDENIDFPEDLF